MGSRQKRGRERDEREKERGLAGRAFAGQNDSSEGPLQSGSCTFLNLKFKVIQDFKAI